MKDVLLQIFLAAGTSIIGYVLGYRKQNVDLQSSRLDSLEKSINVYNVIIDDMAKKIETLTTEVTALERRIEELMDENKRLKNKSSI
jgi:predicted RNase H-like nuclease (RuvC/YqgF family)